MVEHGTQMAIEIGIQGMTCGGCVNAVRNALTRAGFSGAEVEVGRARIATEGDAQAVDRVRAAIEKAGFVPTTITQT